MKIYTYIHTHHHNDYHHHIKEMRQKESKVRRKIIKQVSVGSVQRPFSIKFYTGARTKLYLWL